MRSSTFPVERLKPRCKCLALAPGLKPHPFKMAQIRVTLVRLQPVHNGHLRIFLAAE